jgi:hypothetical protein
MLMWLTISPKNIYFFKFENKPNFNDKLIYLHLTKSIKILGTWGTKDSLQGESQLIVQKDQESDQTQGENRLQHQHTFRL